MWFDDHVESASALLYGGWYSEVLLIAVLLRLFTDFSYPACQTVFWGASPGCCVVSNGLICKRWARTSRVLSYNVVNAQWMQIVALVCIGQRSSRIWLQTLRDFPAPCPLPPLFCTFWPSFTWVVSGPHTFHCHPVCTGCVFLTQVLVYCLQPKWWCDVLASPVHTYIYSPLFRYPLDAHLASWALFLHWQR